MLSYEYRGYSLLGSSRTVRRAFLLNAYFITLGVLEPGFSHLTMPMSLLGGIPGTRGLVFNNGVAATGVLVIIFGFGLRRQLPEKISTKIGTSLLMTGGLALIGAGIFHCNEGCRNILAEPDVVGRLHIITSLLAGMATGLAPFFIWAAMRHDNKWQHLTTPTLLAGVIANLPGITFWTSFFTGLRLHSIEGLIQRMGFAVVMIWIFYLAARLWRLAPRSE